MSDLIAAAMDRKIEEMKARRCQRMRDGNYGLARQDLARIKRARTRMLKHELGLMKNRNRRARG